MGGCECPWDGCVHARRQAVNARFGNDSMYSFEFMTRVSVCTICTAQVAVVTPYNTGSRKVNLFSLLHTYSDTSYCTSTK